MTSSDDEPAANNDNNNECNNNNNSNSECIPVAKLDTPNDVDCNPTKSQCISISDKSCVRLCYGESPAPLPSNTPDSLLSEEVRKLCAEFVGTGLLVMVVVASGISAENLTQDVGLQLLINSIATMTGLYGLITIFGPVSGAHFNPIVSLVDVLYKDMSYKTFAMYIISQCCGGIVGCILANIQFAIPVTISTKQRFGYELWISEVIATSTLILIIHGCVRTGKEASVPTAVACWVGGGYFFTSSSIFANPAVTIGRIFTNTFAGISPKSAGVYICFQIIGALIGFGLSRGFYPIKPQPLKSDDNLYRRACVLDLQEFYQKGGY